MAEQKRQQIKVSFEHADQFRTIQVDGAWGGVTPQGGISMLFYHERQALPTSLTITGRAGGKATEKRSGGAGIVRVMESEARMSPAVARAVADWLVTKAEEAESFLHAAAEIRAAEADSSAEGA